MKVFELATLLIITFVIVLVSAANDAEAGDITPYIEVGSMFGTGDSKMAGVGALYRGKWDFSLSYWGEGENQYGAPIDKAKTYAVTRLFRPGWVDDRFFIGVGVAKTESQGRLILIGEWNFNLVFGLRFGKATPYIRHISSAGVNENNTGVNAGLLRLEL